MSSGRGFSPDARAKDVPVILGVRHHSPACARLVAARIRALKPAHVLIEGPADFNARLDELHLPHRLPLAIYSYRSDDVGHRGSWSPFAEHSPEWQALVVAREIGAQARFIDLPAWHDAFADRPNRYADVDDPGHEALAEAYERSLAAQLGIEGRDALWDHLFEACEDVDALGAQLAQYFEHLRGDDPGSEDNAARETMMARWIAWAMARNDGPVVVVCGGYHAPALAARWRGLPPDADAHGAPEVPPTPSPFGLGQGANVRFGSFLVPYSFKRLDAFAGYASGMSSPAFYQWAWEHGAEAGGARALRAVLERLRRKSLPASTADFMAVHARAQALARLRGHAQPQRADLLDAVAGTLVKDALDAPLPWSYRGPIRPGTDPVLVEVMDVLAGDRLGKLAPATPQPPLVHAVAAELAALGLALEGEATLDLLDAGGRARSRVLHRLAILAIPGIDRVQGPALALSGERRERWKLSAPLEQTAALIEAGAYGATLADAARARLEEQLRAQDARVAALAQALNLAAFAGLGAMSDALLADLPAAIAAEPSFEAIGGALAILHPLLRHGAHLDMAGAPVLRTAIEAAFDRGLWLFEPGAALAAAHVRPHLHAVAALRDVVREQLADEPEHALAIQPGRARAVLQRKVADVASDPTSRGAALGALVSLRAPVDDEEFDPMAGDIRTALALLGTLPPARLGDALAGLVALAREQIGLAPAFVMGLDRLVQGLDDGDFVLALPAMRAAFAWLPARERGTLAQAVLGLHGETRVSRHTLTARIAAPAGTLAATAALERRVVAALAQWGLDTGLDDGAAA